MRLCSPPNDSRGAGRASSNHRLPLIPHHDRGGGPLWPAPACRQRGPGDLFGHLWSGRACRDRHCFHMGPAISAPFSNQGPGAGVIHHFVPERERSVFIGFFPCRPLFPFVGLWLHLCHSECGSQSAPHFLALERPPARPETRPLIAGIFPTHRHCARASPTSDSPKPGKWSSASCGACMSRFGSREAGWLLGQSRTAAGSNWQQTG